MITTVCDIRLRFIACAAAAVIAAVSAAVGQTGQQDKPMMAPQEAPDNLNDKIAKENNIVVQQTKYVPYEESDGKPRSLKKRICLEIGGAVSPYSYYNSGQNSKNDNGKSVYIIGGGVYSRTDLIYAELFYDVIIGYGWSGEMAGVLTKYPIGNDVIKLSPLLGYGVIFSGNGLIFGGRFDVGITEIAYLRSEYLYCSGRGGAADAMSFKIGGGLDKGLGDAYYVRYELMYMYHREALNNDYPKKSNVHHFDIRFGTGYKWGGRKKINAE